MPEKVPVGCRFGFRHQAFLRHSDFACRTVACDSGAKTDHFFCLFALTSGSLSDSIERVKWLVLFALLALECSCTTIANRRDLYSPQPDPDLDWHRQVPTTSHAEEPASSLANR